MFSSDIPIHNDYNTLCWLDRVLLQLSVFCGCVNEEERESQETVEQ